MKNIFDVVTELENGTDNQIDYYHNLQRMINQGQWSLQGVFGRAMMKAIEDGYCMLGPDPAFDAYHNRIPSRTEVKEGTKGSHDYVISHAGSEHAKLMMEVK